MPGVMHMTKPILTFSNPDEVETVYYEAFMHCDTDVMAACWAADDVICVHPGSGAIVGHEAVVRSWSHILSNAQPPQITYNVAKRTVSDELAVHVVTETMGAGEQAVVVLATNVYRKFEQGWLMIEHHASLVQTQRQGQTIQ
jgi:ketosteroid isomerase-like protein